MDDIIAAALADAEAAESLVDVDDAALDSISKLADHQLQLEETLAHLEKLAKDVKYKLEKVSQESIPSKMAELGIKSIELDSGAKLTVSKKYIGSIKKDNLDVALKWFIETKRAGVVTPKVVVDVSKGELARAEVYVEKMKEAGIPVHLEPSVHYQTLRAVTRELYESGDEIPEWLNTHVVDETKIKGKK